MRPFSMNPGRASSNAANAAVKIRRRRRVHDNPADRDTLRNSIRAYVESSRRLAIRFARE